MVSDRYGYDFSLSAPIESAHRLMFEESTVSDGQNRFYEWNYDEGVVILYERLGECNGCGDCCLAAIQFTVAGRLNKADRPWEEFGNGGPERKGPASGWKWRVAANRPFCRTGATQLNGGSVPPL